MELNESSLSRIYQHSQEHETGMLTAFRYARECGNGVTYSKAENIARNKSLKAKLLHLGYGVTPVKGAYIENYGSPDAREVREESFFVVDIKNSGKLKTNLTTLGKTFDQDAVLFIHKGAKDARLIGTSICPNAYPEYKKEEKLTNAIFGKSGEFLTRVNGRPFIFESAGDTLMPPRERIGMWAMKLSALKEWEEYLEGENDNGVLDRF